jgi:hydrogenase expression/formation protein HypC
VCLGAIGRITRVWEEGGVPMALVHTGDGEVPACLLYVPGAGEGDHVLVHLGFAVEPLDPPEAAAALAMRRGAEDVDRYEEGSS